MRQNRVRRPARAGTDFENADTSIAGEGAKEFLDGDDGEPVQHARGGRLTIQLIRQIEGAAGEQQVERIARAAQHLREPRAGPSDQQERRPNLRKRVLELVQPRGDVNRFDRLQHHPSAAIGTQRAAFGENLEEPVEQAAKGLHHVQLHHQRISRDDVARARLPAESDKRVFRIRRA